MKNDKKVEKYTAMYMSLGMCIGISIGMCFGAATDKIGFGLCIGLSIGVAIGLALGSAKDKRLSENLVEIISLEESEDGQQVTVTVKDKNGEEKKYVMNKKAALSEKLAVGITAADDNGTIVSIS